MTALALSLPGRLALVALAYALLLGAAEAWYRIKRPPAEWTRKFAHLGGGAVALSFPWLFDSVAAVAALGIGFALLLWGTRRMGLLPSIHAVERRSEGGAYYPVAILLLFILARHDPVLYVVPLGALVASDAAAALIGTSYGRLRYRVEDGHRTTEGSVVFFLVTFLVVHIPLLLATDVSRGASLLIAAQIALLVTLLEAISLGGNDNLVVPTMTYFLLIKLTRETADFIAYQLVCQLLIIGVVTFIGVRLRLLRTSGVLAASLVFYAAFSLGGWRWIIAPSLALAVFLYVLRRFKVDRRGEMRSYQVRAVFYTGIVPILIVAAENLMRTVLTQYGGLVRGRLFYAPYVGAFAAQLGLLIFDWISRFYGEKHSVLLRSAVAVTLSVTIVLPVSLVLGPQALAPRTWATALALPLLAFAAYLAYRLQRGPAEPGTPELRRHASAVAVAAALAIGSLYVL